MKITGCECPLCGENNWRPESIYLKCEGCGVSHVTTNEVKGFWRFSKLVAEKEAAVAKATKKAAPKTPAS